MTDIYECFTTRLETFSTYKGIPDSILLSRLDFYHIGNNVICCKNCQQLFISWSNDEYFWNKHKKSSCKYTSIDYTYWGDKSHKQDINKWLDKEYIKKLIEYGRIKKEEMAIYIEDFLKLKGDHSSIRLFKDYLMFLKYHCNQYILI
jgi:hypothetical protein